jgi:uroporphyrinogen decarboxylase
MPGVIEDWHAQGLPKDIRTEKDIYDYFGFPTRPQPLPLNVGFDPPFETAVLEETDEHTIAVDWMGRTTKVLKEFASLPLALDFPVKDTATWRDYRRRLTFGIERIGESLEKTVELNAATGHMNTFGTPGFYWFPRDLMGDESLCIAYYEQPELVHDILDTWCTLIERLLSELLERVCLDCIHFGEDMAYRNGSMISRPIFDEFVSPYYQRIQRLIRRFEIPVFSVDTDGYVGELSQWLSECGVNLLGPNEVQAGNDIAVYRKRFGTAMAFDGGLDKLELPKGPDAIDAMLENTVPFMKETGGGWVVCLDHRVVKDTKLSDFQYYVDRVRTMIRF